jgi:hypothetical protein
MGVFWQGTENGDKGQTSDEVLSLTFHVFVVPMVRPDMILSRK